MAALTLLLTTRQREQEITDAAAHDRFPASSRFAPVDTMIGVRTHDNRWIIRDTTHSCAHAMITQTSGDPDPTFRILLCEPFQSPQPLPLEAHSLAEAIHAVEEAVTTDAHLPSPPTIHRTGGRANDTDDVLTELIDALTPPGAIHPALAAKVSDAARAIAAH